MTLIMYTRFCHRLYQTYASSRHFRYVLSPSCQRFLEINQSATLCKSRMELKINYKQLLDAQKDPNVLIVDVREHSEINETGILPRSIHIPMNDVGNIFENLSEEEFQKKYGRPKPTKDTKIIFSCRSGKRSEHVQKAMQKLGYTQAYNYSGGWQEWHQESEKRKSGN